MDIKAAFALALQGKMVRRNVWSNMDAHVKYLKEKDLFLIFHDRVHFTIYTPNSYDLAAYDWNELEF